MKADILKQVNRYQAELMIKSCGLRKKYEDVLIMNYVEDLSHQEIADKLNMTRESVGNLVTKSRKLFEKYTDGL